ncbi:MAG: endonuclease [Ectothiorhodospiraceae bacterium]|nr:endonuclease [Ectothiorhodospiraceae bacterium]
MNKKFIQLAKDRNLLYRGGFLPYNPTLLEHARNLRKHATPEERKLWKFLKSLPIRVLRQRPIDHYIVDFYIPAQNTVIEIDGGQHFSEVGKQMDSTRTKTLELYDLKVLRYTNLEIISEFDAVCKLLYSEFALDR